MAEPPTTQDRWLTTGEAAAILGVTRETVRSLVRKYDLPHFLMTKQMRISEAGLEAFLDSHPTRRRTS